jgi:hypothetical protein
MHRLRIVVVAFLLGVPASMSAQSQRPAPSSTPTGQISGIVASDKEGKHPVRRAVVTVRGERSGDNIITTDADGRFSFEGLPADRYTITAVRPAYLVASFGAKKPGAQGTPLVLADGDRRDIRLWMARGAVISGRVIAPDGLPAAGVTVSAMAPVIADGQRVLLASATAPGTMVDDEGRFRIYGLRPGHYVVMVRPTSVTARGVAVGAEGNGRWVNYAHVYFPGTTEVGDARPVHVEAGEEASGIDIRLQLVPAAGISGVVRLDENSALPPGTRLVLTRAVRGLAPYDGGEIVNVDDAGRFRVPPLSPGRYVIRLVNLTLTPPTAHLGEKPRAYWGRVEVDVNGEDVNDVVLQLRRGLDLPGSVIADSAVDAPPFTPSGVTVSLQGITVDGIRPANPATVRPDASGRFTLTGVGPGRYRVSASFPPMSGRTLGWYLRSVSLDGAVLDGDILDVGEYGGSGHLSLRFTTTPTQVNGRLILDRDVPATGFVIVAFAVNETGWVVQSRNIQNVRPATDGTFSFANLPAGEFYLCVLEELSPADLGDPEFLRRLIPEAVRIMVSDAQPGVLTLKVTR